jgi:hypothetical protein
MPRTPTRVTRSTPAKIASRAAENALVVALLWGAAGEGVAGVSVGKTYSDGTDSDQDDMCIWVHPNKPELSAVIGSDKGNGKIYVYDLSGKVVHSYQATSAD